MRTRNKVWDESLLHLCPRTQQLPPCCQSVKPQSMVRHIGTNKHRRAVKLPLIDTMRCPVCNQGFSRWELVGRHLATQHRERGHDTIQDWLDAKPGERCAC
ncbi:hypothetical protein BC834DRAFT_876140 [Gloeopeniophorella convolvens]|nr:hypothetical protein BC834DRAFT_876140 [Gloeopeniophorella convolvens]